MTNEDGFFSFVYLLVLIYNFVLLIMSICVPVNAKCLNLDLELMTFQFMEEGGFKMHD